MEETRNPYLLSSPGCNTYIQPVSSRPPIKKFPGKEISRRKRMLILSAAFNYVNEIKDINKIKTN